MGPRVRHLAEIRRMESRAVGIAEEAEGARGKRVCANQLADRLARRIVRRQRPHIESEAAALGFAATDRQVGIAEDEAADNVGAAGDRLQRQLGAHSLAGPVELAVIEDRPGRQDRAQGGEVAGAFGTNPACSQYCR